LDQPGRPLLQGFDCYYGYLNQVHAHNFFPATLIEDDRVVPLNNPTTWIKPEEGDDGGGYLNVHELSPAQLLTSQYTPDLFVQKSIEFLNKDHAKPFFLYLPFTLPHANNERTRATGNGAEILSSGSYQNPEWTEADRKHAAMISKLDEGVGAILDHLKRLGLDKNTLVLFTSDNGPQKESGHRPEFFESSGPLNGMKRSLTEGGIRVPMIAAWPGHIPANTVSEHIGYSGDFMATLAELTQSKSTGSDVPSNLDSISLLPTLTQSQLSAELTPIADYFQQFGSDPVLMAQAPSQKKHEYLYWEFYEQGSRAAVRFDQWKLIEEPMLSGELVLYDLSFDLNETTNVIKEFPDIASRGLKYLREGHRDSPDWVVKPLRK
jgi:arylsulfatase A-like enzyme